MIRVLVNEGEHAELQQAADAAGASLSTWVRLVALERARKTK
jgi:predicted HicB family RNase H-like nuclease